MIYLHCHLGKIPEYLLDSMESIYSVDPDSRIILVTDQSVEIEGVEVLEVSDIITEETQNVMKMRLFSNDPNPLWRTSIFRIFLVRDAILHLNLSYCYHFDSDVLMFQPSSLFSELISDFDGLYITYHNEDEVVFGFSRFGNIEKINEICSILRDIVYDPQKQSEYSVGMANEMQLLGGIYKRRNDLIKRLNILPNETGVVFDPSSYGQYFGGTHQGHPPGWYGEHHIIGEKIGNKILTPIMIDKKPYVEYNGEKYPIVNLHIHSKNTKIFLE